MATQPLNLSRSRPARILVGDIGATHSRLAIYSHGAGRADLVRYKTYASAENACLTEILTRFLAGEPDIDAACLGLPAPIHSGTVFPLTNLPWKVDRAQLGSIIGTDLVALVNDVEAAAAGIPELSPEDRVCLQAGQADPNGNRAVISIGTGLGVSVLTAAGQAFATEAGHATFSPRRDPDYEFHAALQNEYGHVSWERVASGSALPRIHSFLAKKHACLDGPEIVRRSHIDPTCRQAVEMFRGYVGAAAGNIALTLMATGGVYLAGGAAAKILDKESAAPFIGAFLDKGRMRPLLEKIPVFVVEKNDLALLGAVQKALDLFGSRREDLD